MANDEDMSGMVGAIAGALGFDPQEAQRKADEADARLQRCERALVLVLRILQEAHPDAYARVMGSHGKAK